MKIKTTSEEFLVEGYISSDSNLVTAAIFMAIILSFDFLINLVTP
jgi:hypothetical protein